MSKQLQCILVALGTCLLGSVIVALVTLVEWLNPATPALILIGAALLPAVLGGLLVMSPNDQQPWTSQLIIKGALPGAIFGVLAIGLGLAWSQPQVRADIASKLPVDFRESTPLLRALNESAPVATAACKNIAANNFRHAYTVVLNTLTNRPDVALACLKDSPQHATIIFRLSDSWHQTLLDEAMEPQQTCERSDAIAAITSNHSLSAAQLMDCALQSSDPAARQCCTQTLNTAYSTPQELAKQLDVTIAPMASFALGTELINASFAGQPKLGSLNIESPAFQKIALLTTCSSLQSNTIKSLGSLYRLSQSLNCMDAQETPPTDMLSWDRICKSMEPHLILTNDIQPKQVLCDMLGQDKKLQAIQAAEAEELSPQQAQAMAQLAENIEYGANNNGPKDTQKLLSAMGFRDEAKELNELSNDDFANYQKLVNEQLNKTSGTKTDDARKESAKFNEFAKSLGKSPKDIPQMLDSLEKQKISKEQRESLQKMRKQLENNPNFLND